MRSVSLLSAVLGFGFILSSLAHGQTPAEAEPPAAAPPGATAADAAPAPPATTPAEAAPPDPVTPEPRVAQAPEPVPAQLPLSEPAPPPAAPSEVAPPAAAPTQLKLELPNGNSIRFGLLWQLQYEARGNGPNDDFTHNIFLRRFALLIGGTVLHDLEYFFDSDFADLLKASGDESLKNGPDISTKDAFVTYKGLGDVFKVDGGLLMPALSHNVLQGGASLYSWDFFFNTFRHNLVFGSTGNPYGRDLGIQARGLVFDGLLEYRAGIFQGRRNPPEAGPPARPGSRNFFRVAGRLQLNLLDPETGFFYAGSYLGTKKILSLGAWGDFQPADDGDAYRSWGLDGIVDLPLGQGGVTAQVNLIARDGGDQVELPKQSALAGEAGYRFDAVQLSPIARVERRWGPGTALDETDVGGGLAFWPFEHNSNLKAFYTRVIPSDSSLGFDQFNVQWQLAFY